MECYSQRFQRKNRFLKGSPNTSRLSVSHPRAPHSQQHQHTHKTLGTTKAEHHRSKKKCEIISQIQIWYNLVYLCWCCLKQAAHFLYVRSVTWLSAYSASDRSLLQQPPRSSITCQSEEKPLCSDLNYYSSTSDAKNVSISGRLQTGREKGHSRSRHRQHRVFRSSYLYSSDSEDECINWTGENYGNFELNEDNISGELPLLGVVDQIVQFFIYRVNFCAFIDILLGDPWSRSRRYKSNLKKDQHRRNLLNTEIQQESSFIGVVAYKFWLTMKGQSKHVAQKTLLLRWALASRVAIFLLQMIAFNLLSIFKHQNDGFKFIPEEAYGKMLDPLVNATLGGYVNWDANFFLHISVYGYTSENIMAFFPLLPMILTIPSRIVYFFLFPIISLSSIVVIIGVIFNTWLFLKCTENIYELAGLWSGGRHEIISTACLLFSFNPASIFFSGLYTETLFAYLTSSVILRSFAGDYWKASLYVAASCACRSNGTLNLGPAGAYLLQQSLSLKGKSLPHRLITFAAHSIPLTVIGILPFALFQGYGIRTFCDRDKLFDEPGDIPLYCITPKKWRNQVLPYSYIQKKYWNVGLFEYFELKQIPNFILAAPVLYILSTECATFFKASVAQVRIEKRTQGIYFALQAVHGLFLSVFCFLFVHVQVSTRMIMSSCPYLFIYLADLQELDVEKFRSHQSNFPMRSVLVMFWCGLYYIVGTIGFSLGLPWT